MSIPTINRVAAGVPTGGEYTAHKRQEAASGVLDAPATKPEDITLGALVNHADPEWVKKFASDSETPPVLLGAILAGGNVDLAIDVAYNEGLTPELFEDAFAHDNAEVRAAAIQNGASPLGSFYALRDDPAWEVQEAIASSPRCPKDLLDHFADSEDSGVRGSTARNPRASAELLSKLAHDPDEEVRASAALHRSLDEELVRELADDRSISVRLALAGRNDIPEDIAVKFAESPDQPVRLRLSWSPGTPIAALRILIEDDSEQVRSYAKRSITIPRSRW